MADVPELVRLYSELGSLDKVAAVVGMNRTSIHKHLQRAGIEMSLNLFSEADRTRLRNDYKRYRDKGKLDELATDMGRTKQFIARHARELGLTEQKGEKPYSQTWKNMPYGEAEKIWDDFRSSSYTLGQFLSARGYSDLSFRRTMKEHFGDEWDAIIEGKTPRSTPYRLGRQVEYAVRDKLAAAGYYVMRSPGSRSPVDLLAIATGVVLFVQCKRGGAIGVAEWNKLFNLAISVGAVPVLASRPVPRKYEFFRMDAVKDGSRRKQPMTPVSLWDADGPAVLEAS